MTSLKVTIRHAKDGKFLGFVNGRHYMTWPLTEEGGKQVERWQERMGRVDVYPNLVSGTGMPGRWATCIDNNFTYETFNSKVAAIKSLIEWANK